MRRAGWSMPAGSLSLTTKPQAMLVDENSTSVDTVKKEPPFAKIEAGNANRNTSKRRFIHMDEKSLSHV